MRLPSVTTITRTSDFQLYIMALKWPTSSALKYIPRGRRKRREYCRHASPTVGV